MKDFDQRKAAKEFAERWKDKGYEKGQSQQFWTDLLQNVLGVDNPVNFIEFEDVVHIDTTTGFIDGYIPSTKILIEQKGIKHDLRKPIKQSDGSLLNPFQQAKRYIAELPVSKHPRYVITCNFKSFLVYDMNNPNGEPEEIFLKDLGKEYYRLSFIVDLKNEHLKKEEELSFKAGELVGKLYDAFSKQYRDLSNEQSQKDLNELCVRLVFCLYAEDAGLFGRKNVFHDYLSKYDDLTLMRENLIKLFKVLDTSEESRKSLYLEEELEQFPYVNGGLFSNENIEIPTFTEEIKNTLLAKASDEFDWSEISPTIFGAVFESTLNPETRRSGGMHYTSIENIHKVIDPLFLNELREKLNEAEGYKNEKTRNDKLVEFQNYISSLTFFDPACGSGNFLTETYLSLRRLENEALSIMSHGMMMLDIEGIVKVSIQQFYGIEINDFAVKVAKTALWIAEAQMWDETRKIVSSMTSIGDFLPLETYENIVEANALRIDWNEVVPNNKCTYVMGNPPFIGMKEMTDSNKEDMKLVIPVDKFKQMDYVASWYFKAAEYIKNTRIECAFVSSNSITQGEQALTIWEPLLLKYGLIINFAHRTFIWDSEASLKAHVHCVIIGFSYFNRDEKIIYENGIQKKCENINQYLTPTQSLFIDKTGKPICKVEPMTKGAQLIDGGNFILTEEEYKKAIEMEPGIKQYIRRYYNAHDLINGGEPIYALYLENCPPEVLRNSKLIRERVQAVYDYRANNESPSTNVLKDSPTKYFQPQVPNSKSIVVPVVSSINRRYIPICFMPEGMVYTNALFFIDNASIYTFGIITSNVHMAWTRTIAGRLKSDYRYSNTMVYNTFPWPNPTKEQREKIEKTAQLILDTRAKYPNSSLADLYDEFSMPSDLRKAHRLNDAAVMEAYGFPVKNTFTESDCVAELMKLYKELTEK